MGDLKKVCDEELHKVLRFVSYTSILEYVERRLFSMGQDLCIDSKDRQRFISSAILVRNAINTYKGVK